MATITTTTASVAYAFPPSPVMDYNIVTGEMWVVFLDQANRGAIYKSPDNGLSWSFQGNFTVSGQTIEAVGSMRIDSAGQHLHIILKCTADGGTTHTGFYRRIAISSGTPDLSSGSKSFTSTNANNFTGCAVPVVNTDGSIHVFAVWSFSGTKSGFSAYCITVRNDPMYTTTVNSGAVAPYHSWTITFNDTNIGICLDVEHNGDGITSSTPNVWVSILINQTAFVLKAVWKGAKTGWATGLQCANVGTSSQVERDQAALWDGQRFMVMRPTPSSYNTIQIIERNAANTGNTAIRTTPVHPQGVISGAKAMNYNYITKDLRVYAVAAGAANTVYYVDYNRAANTWGSWTLTGWTDPIFSGWSPRRGTYGTAQYDAVTQVGAGSPWTLANQIAAVNFAPTAPTWVTGTAGTVSVNGAAFDVSTSLTLDWDFHDPNTTDVQASYALQRQIGAGTVQWWRVSDSTWQLVETFNTSATTQLTLSTTNWLGGGGASDPAHVYKVTTKDSGGLNSGYSSGLAVVPSTRVDPTVTSPTAAQILNVGNLDVTWTVSEQGAYRIKLVNTATSVTVHDSGYLTDPTPLTPSVLDYSIPVDLPDGFTGQVQLTTKNAEGLSSTQRNVNFSIDFVEPVAPIVTLAADVASGGIDVTATQAAPAGAQPATIQIDVWRRKWLAGTTTALNTNPFFETNSTDWTSVNYSTIARSTAQFHTGVAALLCTPTGAAATPKAQTTTIYPVTVGGRYEFRGWMRSTTTNKTMRIYIDWYNVSNALVSSTTRDITPVANTWIWAWVRGTAPATATQARIAIGQLATPAAGDTMYGDELQLLPANDDDGIRVLLDVTSAVTNLDWRTATGVEYEYRAYAAAGNGTTVWAPWVV